MAQVQASQSQGVPVEGEVEATPSELSQYIGQYGIGADIMPVHGLAPAPPKEAPPPPPQIILDEVQFGDGEARHCLEKWAKSTWFSQRGIADKLSLSKIIASNTFVIKLNTFNEVRTLHEDFRPYYLGEHIDDCHHGFPPGAWQIPLAPRRLYKNETFSMRLPHTDYIKRCHNCWGSGRVQCTTCHGHGHIHCTHCHGSGKIEVSVNRDGVWVKEHNHCHHCHHGHMNCHTCHTHGYVECIVCKGRGRLVHFIRLDVVWKNNKKTTVVHPAVSNDPSDERDRLLAPSEKLADAQGPLIHFEEDLILQPRHPAVALRVNEEVHNQANLILQDTLNPNALTHRQRMKIRGVPTYKIYYTWKGKPGLFWVMGTDRKVHAPKFPRSPVRIMIAVLVVLTLLIVIGALVGTALYFFL